MPGRRLSQVAAIALSAIGLLATGLGAGIATAAAPSQLWQKCDSADVIQCAIPRGVAASPRDGHVFVADQANFRVVEFDAVGNFIKAWGWDVVASGPGDDTVPPLNEFEICVPSNGDTCQKGANGGGVGQFSPLQGLALDSGGNVYVADFSNRRVQKFDPEGSFLLMVGGEVNETSGGNVCPRPGFPADVCKAEAADSGGGEPGEFGAWRVGDFIGIDDSGTSTDVDDKVYVGDEGRIQRFDTDGVYQSEIARPGETVQSLAVESTGNIYVIHHNKPDAFKLDAAGTDVCTLDVDRPTAIAADEFGLAHVVSARFASGSEVIPLQVVQFDAGSCEEADRFAPAGVTASTGLATNWCPGSDPPGNLYITDTGDDFVRAYGTSPAGCIKAITGEATDVAETSSTLNGTVDPDGSAVSDCVFEYGTSDGYGQEAPCAETPAEIGEGGEPVDVHADIAGLTKGTVYHFRLRATVGGVVETGFEQTFKTLGPPVVSDEHLFSATDTDATLRASVSPEGFATTYRFQYATQAAFDANGFEGAEVTFVQSIGEAGDRNVHTASAVVSGLQPGQSYRWRIVAVNSSGTTEGEDRAFVTYRPLAAGADCPNQALRAGASAFLPDCRAYEMVSPVDKNGSDIVAGRSFNFEPSGYAQVSSDGESIAYGSEGSFAGQPNSFKTNQYLADRQTGEGWTTEGIQPPVHGSSVGGVIFGVVRQFMAFTPDLCSAWLIDYQTPPPTADGQEGHRNLYRRSNCDPKGLEALMPDPPSLPPATGGSYVSNTSVQGASDDGSHALFVANAPLPHAPEAAPGTHAQIYDRFGGGVHLVSVLPGGGASTTDSAVGSGWAKNVHNAVSADGSSVYWTAGIDVNGRGTIYRREHPEQGIVAGECEDAGEACTRSVSGPLPAFFWSAASDGSKALYDEFNLAGERDLYLFDESQPRKLVAGDIEGVVGTGEDLSHVYFVSDDVLAGAAQADEPNLYVYEAGTVSFVATLDEGDVSQSEHIAYDLSDETTYFRASRVSATGERIVFQSRAPLTGFDNRDGQGRRLVQVFTYEAGGDLSCVSCNPSGARPMGREMLEPYVAPSKAAVRTEVFAAAWIPTWEHPLHASNVVSADGSRIFFNSNDRLVPRDTNGAQDVYEWEVPGKGTCTEESPSYHEDNGGCLYLISSGESSFESEFWEASPDGEDVFFTTASGLVPQDPGLVDLYDARVGGGIPQPAARAVCEGEACQSPPPPPRYEAPASGSYRGPGDLPVLRNCQASARRALGFSRRAKRLRRVAVRVDNRALTRRMNRKARRFSRSARKLSMNAKRCRRANRRAAR